MPRYGKQLKCPICDKEVGTTAADLAEHNEEEHLYDDAQTTFGGRCEDFPCCGHDAGDCPVYRPGSGYYPYPCIGCGKRIKIGSADDRGSSYCSKCYDKVGLCTCDEGQGQCSYHEAMSERDDYDDEDVE